MSSLERTKQIRLAHMNAAKGYAQLSRAIRLKVGAVLVKDNRVVSVGYNGTPSGMDNSCEIVTKRELVGAFVEKERKTRPEVVHAEMNVIAFAARNGVSTDGCDLYITHSPCFECCKLIAQSGIKAVYYDEEYRIIDGLKFLKELNITTEKI